MRPEARLRRPTDKSAALSQPGRAPTSQQPKKVTVRSKSFEASGLPTPFTTVRRAATPRRESESVDPQESPSQGRSQSQAEDDNSTATESVVESETVETQQDSIPPPSAQPQQRNRPRATIEREEEDEAVFDKEAIKFDVRFE